MSDSVVLQIDGKKTNAQDGANEGSRFTWNHFVRTTRVQLIVALCVFVLGVGVAVSILILLGKRQGGGRL